jgi:hypothetical protein
MPNILLETLGGDKNSINVAFYYDVPVNKRLAGAADSTREPARGTSTNLNAAGKTGLKDGSVYEYIQTVNPNPNMDAAAIKVMLITNRTDLALTAANEYNDKYKFVGVAYNGATWVGD